MMKQQMSELSQVDKVEGKDFPDANVELRNSLATLAKVDSNRHLQTRFLEEKQLLCIHDDESHGTKIIEQEDRELDDILQQWC